MSAPFDDATDFELIRWVVTTMLPSLSAECGKNSVIALIKATGTAQISQLAAMRLKQSLFFRAVGSVDMNAGIISFDDPRYETILSAVEVDGDTFRHTRNGRIGPVTNFGIYIKKAA